MKVNCENPRRMPSLSRYGDRREFSGRYFLNSPQSVHNLHRFFTGLQGLPLAGSTFAGAKSKRGSMQATRVLTEVCSICGGSGWKQVGDNGARQVTRCDCRVKARHEVLLAAARIPKRYEHCEFSNFDYDGPHKALFPARMSACRFVEEYPLDKIGLMFVGNIGVGKTHLAVSIAKAMVLEKGTPCVFYDYRDLLKQIQNSYNASVQVTELQVLKPVFETEVLVLDELGAVKPTEWVWDTVSLILNTRYNENRTTIITTNFSDQPAAAFAGSLTPTRAAAREETLGDRIGERMRSRLHEMCRIVKMEGTDYRQLRSASFR
jgi:DNA replication protein DnaC